MVALGLNLSETTGKAEFEHRLKTFIHFVHDQCRYKQPRFEEVCVWSGVCLSVSDLPPAGLSMTNTIRIYRSPKLLTFALSQDWVWQ